MAEISKRQDEDTWSWVEIGDPFPDGPMRVKGEMNQYIALWYKNGKPLCGRAWNDGGVVSCSFPYKSAELCGKSQLGGKIQILTYDTFSEQQQAWRKCGYWYEWVKWSERRKANCQMVRCGDASPVIMKGADGNTYAGNMEISSETLSISHDGKTETKNTGLGECMTIVRNLADPGYKPPEAPPAAPVDYDDRWIDVRDGDDWSRVKFHIPALEGKGLKGHPPPMDRPSVVLWYKNGQPVMGAMWEENGKIRCKFGWGGNEYERNIGSIQDCAPCVIPGKDGKEYLGKVIVSQEKASYPAGGKEHEFIGPQVQQFMVLARTD